MALVLISQRFLDQSTRAEEIDLTVFEQMVEEGSVVEVTILERTNVIEGGLAPGITVPDVPDTFRVQYTAEYEGTLTELLLQNDVKVVVDPEPPGFWDLVVGFLPWLLIFGFMFFVIMQMQSGGSRIMQFGRSKAKQVTKDQPKVTFEDVAGLEEAIEELGEIKDFLQSPDKFRAMGAKIPKGVLLYGPPGTGKTLLARAVAGEAEVPFFSISGSDFVEMFVGVGASRVRDLFEKAKSSAPAIVFIDEIDAVGRHRGAGLGGGHDEREQTLNQLLVELDGFDVAGGVIVIAATNRPDILDPALLRPGRFDRQVVVDRPDLKGRHAILDVHAKGKPISDEVDMEALARQTPGFTGADLANLINEGALLAARRGQDLVGPPELEEAIDRVIAGPERKSRVMSDQEKKVTAYHEGGHALVGFALPNADPIHKVTIIPRGRAGGYTLALPMEDRNYMRRSELTDQLAMLMGGRAAEELIFVDPTTGASNDIEKATEQARRMVMDYGMSDQLGPMKYGKNSAEVFLGRDYSSQQDYSNEVAAAIDDEVRALLGQAHDEARRILTTHIEALHRLAERLIEVETLSAEEIVELLSDVPKWEARHGSDPRIQAPSLTNSGLVEGVAAAQASEQTVSLQ
ncbi:MAG: ATP-dependent metallopeptidase FtsH/Yme1/Tma family protein [Acidimicrobiia bacterium]|nr:ATP-dependent zinc metalloprotease FtsH [bacterium]MXZ07722.1 ATP-dependent metallopeptidase FtsH/Yme1/Tma family protein [Acidimicrobiia bacterium]MCY3579268.1 ATP-dependent zinc metalloprotease FtsH [bacterium]MCY3652588.1 ATP-dependent zinc metalloprotease FtsH [bacterium]MDE0643839.1 ATP-dependent zinc metalloprotease FtsH [bacterium]